MPTNQQKLWKDLSASEQRSIAALLKNERNENQPRLKPQRPPSFQLKGYVRCELSSIDKADFADWFPKHGPEALFDLLLKAVSDGYLFKIGVGKEGYTASLSAFDTGKVWDGYVLTAFASSPDRAIAGLWFKHHVLLKADWGDMSAEHQDDFLR